MRKIILIMVVVISLTVLLAGCATAEPVVQQRIVIPDLSVMRLDAYELFPLISEPQTDSDLLYNSLVNELFGALEEAYANMLERQLEGVRSLL